MLRGREILFAKLKTAFLGRDSMVSILDIAFNARDLQLSFPKTMFRARYSSLSNRKIVFRAREALPCKMKILHRHAKQCSRSCAGYFHINELSYPVAGFVEDDDFVLARPAEELFARAF